MKRLLFLVVALVFSDCALASQEEHVIYGLPLEGIPIHHVGYSCGYKTRFRCSVWVSYRLVPEYSQGEKKLKEAPEFVADSEVVAKGLPSASAADYRASGVWLLQLFAHADALGRNVACEKEAFSLANALPEQPNKATRQLWNDIEGIVRGWAATYKEVWVITGPVLGKAPVKTSSGSIPIPEAFFKIVVRKDGDSVKTVTFKVPQDGAGKPELYVTSVDEIEELTGLDFLKELPEDKQRAIESTKSPMWSGSSTGGRSKPVVPSGGNDAATGGGSDDGGVPAAGGGEDKVWVITQKGVYYSKGSQSYGKGDGAYMPEADAQLLGFKKTR